MGCSDVAFEPRRITTSKDVVSVAAKKATAAGCGCAISKLTTL
jgi:hypothetical protein